MIAFMMQAGVTPTLAATPGDRRAASPTTPTPGARAEPSTDTQLIALLREANARKDSAAIEALCYWAGTPPALREEMTSFAMRPLWEAEITSIRMVRYPADRPIEFEFMGTTYRLNLRPTMLLRVSIRGEVVAEGDEGDERGIVTTTMDLPVASLNGRLWIPQGAPTRAKRIE